MPQKKSQRKCRIQHFPISFFSVILGLGGFTIALQKVEQLTNILHISNYVLDGTLILFGILSIIYLIKILRFPEEVKKEFSHPVKLSFFPTFSISLLLFSIAFLEINQDISKDLWLLGTIIHLIFTLKIVSIWIQHEKFEITHMNPAWFIPAVGNILVPVAGISHFNHEVSWFFFSIGLLFWIILLVIFINRIIFHKPLSDKLVPTLFILIAPPAVGFISYVKLTGALDNFAKILYYFALFLVLLILSQVKMFYRIKYYLSWWAYSFPISAITIASILMYHSSRIIFFKYLAFGLFAFLSIIILILLTRTLYSISKREICIEED